MTKVVTFFFVVFCYFVLSYRDEQAGNIGKRNFSLSAFSEKLVQTCTKSVIVAVMLLKLTTEGFLICRKQTNKQTNIFMTDDKSLYYVYWAQETNLKLNFLQSPFECIIQTLSGIFTFSSSLITMSWSHLLCTFPMTTFE